MPPLPTGLSHSPSPNHPRCPQGQPYPLPLQSQVAAGQPAAPLPKPGWCPLLFPLLLIYLLYFDFTVKLLFIYNSVLLDCLFQDWRILSGDTWLLRSPYWMTNSTGMRNDVIKMFKKRALCTFTLTGTGSDLFSCQVRSCFLMSVL